MKFNANTSYQTAFELTKIALEQNQITYTNNPKESAKNVVDYFNTIFDSLQNAEDNQSSEK